MTGIDKHLDMPIPPMDPALAARVRHMLDGQPDGDDLAHMLGVEDGAPAPHG